MKQAILIIAHKDIGHLQRIIRCFDTDFYFFIHFDKNAFLARNEHHVLCEDKRVKFFIQKYKVNWGSLNILKATLLLCRQALEYPEIEYLHLISGVDFPAKPCVYFKSFFEKNKANQYMNHFSLPTPNWTEGGLNRLKFYYFTDWINVRNERGQKWMQKSIEIQKRFHIERSISKKYKPLWGGSNWWSLNRECVAWVVADHFQNYSFLKRLRNTFIPDEIYFQSVVMKSPYSSLVINDNLRYIDWTVRNGNVPACLDVTDFDKIINSDKVFIRKIEHPTSNLLLCKLEKYISLICIYVSYCLF